MLWVMPPWDWGLGSCSSHRALMVLVLVARTPENTRHHFFFCVTFGHGTWEPETNINKYEKRILLIFGDSLSSWRWNFWASIVDLLAWVPHGIQVGLKSLQLHIDLGTAKLKLQYLQLNLIYTRYRPLRALLFVLIIDIRRHSHKE